MQQVHSILLLIAVGGFLHSAALPISNEDRSTQLLVGHSNIEKRSPLSLSGLINETPDTSAITGASSLLIQIFGGLLQSMLDVNGMHPESVNQAINLFSPENKRVNIILARRTLNWIQRFSSFLNRVLPAPSVGDNGFYPLNLIKTKVSLYSTQQNENGIGSILSLGPASATEESPSTNKVETVATSTPVIIEKMSELETVTAQTKRVTVDTSKPLPTVADEDVRIYSKGTSRQLEVITMPTPIPTNDDPAIAPTKFTTKSGDIPFVPSRRYKNGLPDEVRQRIFAQLPFYSKMSNLHVEGNYPPAHDTSKKDLSTYGSVAELPLERDTYFDRQESNAIDSFGVPIQQA